MKVDAVDEPNDLGPDVPPRQQSVDADYDQRGYCAHDGQPDRLRKPQQAMVNVAEHRR